MRTNPVIEKIRERLARKEAERRTAERKERKSPLSRLKDLAKQLREERNFRRQEKRRKEKAALLAKRYVDWFLEEIAKVESDYEHVSLHGRKLQYTFWTDERHRAHNAPPEWFDERPPRCALNSRAYFCKALQAELGKPFRVDAWSDINHDVYFCIWWK